MADSATVVLYSSLLTTPHRDEGQHNIWKLSQELTAGWYKIDKWRNIIVKAGFLTDFASIPEAARPIITPMDTRIVDFAAIHDWLYTVHGDAVGPVSRAEADTILYQGCLLLGMEKWLANMVWEAVSAFGPSHWKLAPQKMHMKLQLTSGGVAYGGN